jgi:voltage-gated potassium channel
MNEIKSKYEIFKRKVHIIIYGTNTVAGRLFDLILLGLILLSVVIVMLETVKEFDGKYHTFILISEWVISLFFTFEYLLRIITIKKPIRYVLSFYGIIDLIAILPMYLSFFITGTSVLSVIRALRLLRLFKILNHPQFNNQSKHLKESLLASKGKILIFMYFMLISTIVIGSVMYVIEGEASGFTSIPTGIYWAIVTLTTVGYGDISPVTPLGQFIASFVMIMGYGIIAVPTGIVSAEFAKNKPLIKESETKVCQNCGSHEHYINAKFCQDCGHEL